MPRVRPAPIAVLAAMLLAGCWHVDVPNTGDDEVEVIVANFGPSSHWYNVTVLRGAAVVLQGNVTVYRPPGETGEDPRTDPGYNEVGDVRPGSYEVVVRSSGGPTVSQMVDVTTRHVIYIHQDPDRVRIHLSELGE